MNGRVGRECSVWNSLVEVECCGNSPLCCVILAIDARRVDCV